MKNIPGEDDIKNHVPDVKRIEIFSWCLYDFANSSFTTLIVTVAYAVYFKSYVCTPAKGDFFWGLAFSISMLFVALTSPIFGAMADFSAQKKRYLIYYTLAAVICTALLFFVQKGNLLSGIILFIIANIGFEGGYVFYNAFLTEISRNDNIGRISGYGWAAGYAGGLLSLLIASPLIKEGLGEENILNFRLSFPVVALFYFVFSIPIFLWIRERALPFPLPPGENYVTAGFRRLSSTLSHIRKYREAAKFIVASLIYTDGMTTVIVFSSIYAVTTLNYTMREVTLLFIATQFTAFAGAALFGHLQDWIGGKKAINLTLILWCVVCAAAYLATTKLQFFIIAMIAGLGMGSNQSVSRSFMGLFIPKGRDAEFFGFYILSGKFASILGPVLFGYISSATGNQRIAILFVTLFFLLGLIVMAFVSEEKGIHAAKSQ
ncbi:MAG: MFS transporter [Acidobacteriota bacterium]